MIKYCILLLMLTTQSFQDFVNLSSKVKLVNATQYMSKIIQETFSAIEDRGFCNLKLKDFNDTLNETMYNWKVDGHVEYSNGFLYTIDTINVKDVSGSMFTSSTTDLSTASFSATVQFLPAVVGYDVAAYLIDDGVHLFTGIYSHSHIIYIFYLSKNMNTNEMTAYYKLDSVASGSGTRMVYMPENSVSEVISRKFIASTTVDNAKTWADEIILPIMLEKAKTIEFPKIYFS